MVSLHKPRWPKMCSVQLPGACIRLEPYVTCRTGQFVPPGIFPRQCAEELLPLQVVGQPCRIGLFLWDRVYGILFWGLMLPADRLCLQTQKLTRGSFFPVISLHQKWVTESERSKVKLVQGSNEEHSWSVCTCASSCKGLQLSAMQFKEMAHRNGAARSNSTITE